MTKKSITVELDDRELEVKKLPIGKYSELLAQVKELPKHAQGLDNLSNEKIFEMLPGIIASSLPDFIAILTIATDMKKEELEELGLDEIVKIVVAVWEINNYSSVYDNIKKVVARPELPATAKK